jgi:hypothetical protein
MTPDSVKPLASFLYPWICAGKAMTSAWILATNLPANNLMSLMLKFGSSYYKPIKLNRFLVAGIEA